MGMWVLRVLWGSTYLFWPSTLYFGILVHVPLCVKFGTLRSPLLGFVVINLTYDLSSFSTSYLMNVPGIERIVEFANFSG